MAFQRYWATVEKLAEDEQEAVATAFGGQGHTVNAADLHPFSGA